MRSLYKMNKNNDMAASCPGGGGREGRVRVVVVVVGLVSLPHTLTLWP